MADLGRDWTIIVLICFATATVALFLSRLIDGRPMTRPQQRGLFAIYFAVGLVSSFCSYFDWPF